MNESMIHSLMNESMIHSLMNKDNIFVKLRKFI